MTDSLANLKPCPFCGTNQVTVVPANYWTGMKSVVLSVELRHWCEPSGNRIDNVFIRAKGKTEENAVDQWNRRIAG